MKVAKRERAGAQPPEAALLQESVVGRFTFVCPPATTNRPAQAPRPPRRSALGLRLRLTTAP